MNCYLIINIIRLSGQTGENMKMKYILLILSLCAGLTLTSCRNTAPPQQNAPSSPSPIETQQTAASWQSISPEEAYDRLKNEEGIFLLDVRTAEEWKEGHIPGSFNIPVDNVADGIAAQPVNHDDTIFIYCRSGNRSKTAANALIAAGYTNVYDLGGIGDWPYEVVVGEETDYSVFPLQHTFWQNRFHEGEAASEGEQRQLIPDFTLPSNTGSDISLSDYNGSIVVLNFWASWCPPCVAEMPEFVALENEFESRGDVKLLTINLTDGMRETRDDADGFIDKNGYDFTVLYDEQGEVSGMFGISSIPTTVVIDKEGYLSSYVLGATNYDAVMSMVNEVK